MIETKYATIDRDELKRLQADSEELSKLRAHPAALAPAAVAVVPDEVRVNLDSLWADAAYLCARLEQDSMPADDVVKVIRDRIDAAKAALSLNRRAIPVGLLEKVLAHIDRNTCTHEETHRGGAIWEICDSCGAKWADDEGGKPEFKWPDYVDELRALLGKS